MTWYQFLPEDVDLDFDHAFFNPPRYMQLLELVQGPKPQMKHIIQ